MLKKLYASVVVASLLVMSPAVAVASSKTPVNVKENFVCKVQNQKVIKNKKSFVCVKSGSRLVWKTSSRKTTVVSKPASVSPTVIASRPSSSYDIFVAWANANRGSKLNHFSYRDTNLSNSFRQSIDQSEMLATQIFANFISKDTYSYAGVGDSWFQMQSRPTPLNNGSRCFSDQRYLAACADMNDSVFYRVPSNYNPGSMIDALGAHEYFHLVQASLGNYTAKDKRTIPTWFTEGSAEFVGLAIMSMMQGKDYDVVTNNLPKYSNLHVDPYNSGRYAIEKLVLKYGFNSVLKVFKDYTNNRNFDTIFLDVFGISVLDFEKTL